MSPIPASWDAAFGTVPHAVIGAVAANQFMPPRETSDVDFAVSEHDLDRSTVALRKAGWTRRNPLQLRPPLRGFAWSTNDGSPVEVITVPGAWGEDLVTSALANCRDGVPLATLPHLVILKMIAGRTIDAGDISRMLGHQDSIAIEAVRLAAARLLNREELADLDQLIELGRLEFGAKPGSHAEPERLDPRPP